MKQIVLIITLLFLAIPVMGQGSVAGELFHYFLLTVCGGVTIGTGWFFYRRWMEPQVYTSFGLYIFALVAFMVNSFALNFYELAKGSSGQKLPFIIMVLLIAGITAANVMYGPRRKGKS